MAGPKPMQAEVRFHHRLESCAKIFTYLMHIEQKVRKLRNCNSEHILWQTQDHRVQTLPPGPRRCNQGGVQHNRRKVPRQTKDRGKTRSDKSKCTF